MKKLIVFFTAFVLTQSLFGQTKKALFIGINEYFPEGAKESDVRQAPPNLNGCVNDALSMKEIMQTRFGFEEKNMKMLLNQEATRAQIIKEIENLIYYAKTGDVVFIFYAGHGSQVNNSLSSENDKKDETIVPADAYLGTMDIRDKDIAKLLNKLLAKGVILTVIFDSCHSGSISRDKNPPKYRFSPGDSRDVKDDTIPEPPENNGALIISAARDVEPAKEIKDEHGVAHGGFTASLIKVLLDERPTSSVQNIFNRTEAIMEYNGLVQKPVLAANATRRIGTLLGVDRSQIPTKLQVPVIKVEGGEVVLQAGMPSNISVKTQLERKTDKGVIKLEVTKMDGPNRCLAKVTEGNPKGMKPGDIFEVTNIVMPPEALIKVFLYVSPYDTKNLQNIAEQLGAKNFKTTPGVSPYQSLYYYNNQWMVAGKGKATQTIGKEMNLSIFKSKIVADSTLTFSLPATKALSTSLATRLRQFSVVSVVSDPASADYHLTGRYNNGKIEYAMVNPEMEYALNTDNHSLPSRTNFFTLEEGKEEALVDSLETYMLRIAKVKSWLTMPSPPDDGSFPFGFALRKSSTGQLVGDGGTVLKGDTFGLVFTVDEVNEMYWDRNKRYVYVFSIDNKASMKLMFPQSITAENTYPAVDKQTFEIRKNAPLGPPRLFKVTGTGTDNYIMLTSSEPINDLEIFSQEGVLRADGERGGSDLEKLLRGMNKGTRNELIAPASWSIQRISVKCIPRN